jgi:hypothetical protein
MSERRVNKSVQNSTRLAGMSRFDTTPQTRRRALTLAEVAAILDNAETP